MKYSEYNKIRKDIISNNRVRRMKGNKPPSEVPAMLPRVMIYEVYDNEDTYIGVARTLSGAKKVDGAYSYREVYDIRESESEVPQEFMDKLDGILSKV